jgi:hypothetical protein
MKSMPELSLVLRCRGFAVALQLTRRQGEDVLVYEQGYNDNK